MPDESTVAKSRFPYSALVAIGVAALVIILWFKGYITLIGIRGVLAFIFILGAAVVLHEFGHFIVAKLLKIRVETFSVGFGPRIWGRKWGTTDYRVSAIPLGGYVKLGGDESNAPIEGEGATDIPLNEQFNLRPRWQKFLVAIAGPVMNILTALAIPFIGGLLWGVPITPTSPIVNRVLEGSAAQQAGILRGDKIVAFNGEENPSWDDIRGDIMVVEDEPKPREFVIERNGQRLPITVTPHRLTEGTDPVGDVGILPDYGVSVPVNVKAVTADGPASRAGVQPGDRLVAIDGEPVLNRDQAMGSIFENQTGQIKLTVERNGQQIEIASALNPPKDAAGKTQPRLGVEFREIVPRENVGVSAAAAHAVRSNVQIMKLTGKALKQLFSGERSARNTLSGPIGIYDAAVNSVNVAGWDGIFAMLGFLSLSLGVFNLLPIPVLDGGAIFILLVEAVLALGGWKLSMRVRERIQQVGFVMLLLLMGFVITNDVLKKVSRNPEETKPPAATATPQK